MKRTCVRKIERVFDKMDTSSLVRALFFKYPSKEFTLSEVAKETKLSKSTVSEIISELKKTGFVLVRDLNVVYRIKANIESPAYRKEKMSYNISSIIKSDLVEFIADKHHSPKAIILFGSFRRGEDDEDSDIDIAVEVPKGEKTGNLEYEELKEFGKSMNRKVVVHLFNRKDVDPNVFLGIANGIVLYGLLEIKR